MNNTKRLRYIDNVKGITILLMLFSHTLFQEGTLRTFISSFQMQMFFVVCGILIQHKYGNKTIGPGERLTIVKRRLRSLGMPYLLFSVLLAVFYVSLNLISGKDTGAYGYVFRIITLQGMDSLWFLPVYFFSEQITIAFPGSEKGGTAASIAAALSVIGLCVIANRIPTSFWLRILIKSLIGFVFVRLGMTLQRFGLLEKISCPWAAVLLAAGAFLSHLNGFAAIGSLEIGNGLLFFSSAALICTSILCVFQHAEKWNLFRTELLEQMGRNTIVVVCTNNLLIETIRLLDYKLTGNYLLRHGLAGCVLFFVILSVCELLLIRFSRNNLAFLFGRTGQKVNER